MVELTMIYGEGKGKTTYALGYIYFQSLLKKETTVAQFLKTGKNCGECIFFEKNNLVNWFNFGKEEFFTKRSNKNDFRAHITLGIKELKSSLEINNSDILLLDELGVVLFFKLLKWRKIQELFKFINEEIIITGRKIPRNIRKKATKLIYVSEEKHPYNKGIEAREGIDF